MLKWALLRLKDVYAVLDWMSILMVAHKSSLRIAIRYASAALEEEAVIISPAAFH